MTKRVMGDFQNDAKRAKRQKIVIEGREKAKKEDRPRGTILLKCVDFPLFLLAKVAVE